VVAREVLADPERVDGCGLDRDMFPHDPDGDQLMGRWDIDGLGVDNEALSAMYTGNVTRLVSSLRT
jgi:hypothetical protein